MSDLHKSKHYDLKYMFNETSRYIYDKFTIDNPEYEKHILDTLYISSRKANKAKHFRQRNFFLNIKVFAMMIIPAFSTNAKTLEKLNAFHYDSMSNWSSRGL